MRKVLVAILILLIGQIQAQDTINVYDLNNIDGKTFTPGGNPYNGEYQIDISRLYWLDYKDMWWPTTVISYDIECVSFPFIPDCFNIESTIGNCFSIQSNDRTFTVIPDIYFDSSLTSPYYGKGWNYSTGKTVYQKLEPQEFINEYKSHDNALSSLAYTGNTFISSRKILPHSILKITLNVHDGSTLESSIEAEISWIYDNTRGRMKNYPFVNSNYAPADPVNYDVIFVPSFVHGQPHHYDDTTNIGWFTGSHPSYITATGSINYYYASDVPVNYHPGNVADTFPNIYIYPAPYSLLTAPLRNSEFEAYAGYDGDGVIQSGWEHTYKIDETIDLTLINPSEKIIYNPSNVSIDSNLTFPEDYKFLTVHGKYPDKAWVNENNPGYTDLRDVLCPSDQIDASGNFLSTYKVKATLIIEENVTIMDAILDGSGTIEYYPDNIYGNFKITNDPKLVFLSDTVTVSDSLVTWENVIDFVGSVIVIDSGATLRIKNTLTMDGNSKIVVKRGGILEVDGGHITDTTMWKGIEVWGTKSAISTSAGAHGKVYLKNSAIIENADFGIRTIRADYDQAKKQEIIYNDYSGGQIYSTNGSKFKNCKNGVWFYKYLNENPSYFRKTTFEISDSIKNSTGIPGAGVYMDNVSGIDFRGCTFINSRDSADIDVEDRGKGIRGIESTFTVDMYEGLGSQNRSVFQGLHYGIYSTYTSSTKLMTIENSNFIKNWRGIYASAMDAGQITLDSFLIDQLYVEDGGCGLYLDNCTGYWVGGNHFYSCWDTTGLGIVVNNSGGDANEIYRNTFDDLQLGISAQGQNKEPRSIYIGLQILCNDFDDCNADLFIPDAQSSYGIAIYQGVDDDDPEDMAGNLFHDRGAPYFVDFDDLNNEADYFKYYYPLNPSGLNDQRSFPNDYQSQTIDIEGNTISDPWVYSDGCPQQTTGGGSTKSSMIGGDMEDQLIYYQNSVDSLETSLNELIDGGNTIALNMEVELSTPPETMEIYNELMGNSPFLSETIVESSIEKETVLPNSLVRDVMVTNSHTAGSEVLMSKLDERNIPMPDYMKAQIFEARESSNQKEEMESKLAGFHRYLARAINGLTTEYLIDSINPEAGYDSLLAIYQSVGGKSLTYRMAMLHLHKGEYQLGQNLLNGIPYTYNLNEEQTIFHNNMYILFNLLMDFYQNFLVFEELDQNTIQLLSDIEQEGLKPGSYARNILVEIGELDYIAPIQLPNLYKSAKEQQEYFEILNSSPSQTLSIFPNPGNDYVIIHYQMEGIQPGTLQIRDVNGYSVKKMQVKRLENQVTINTQDWKSGAYIAFLMVNGKIKESCKFTVVK